MDLRNSSTKKRFGQHWLINQKILEKIKNISELNENDFILEIGPGRGALTSRLLDSNIAGLHAIELDKDLIDLLNKRFSSDVRFSLQQGDILKTDIDSNGKKFTKIIANIPYNITGPILEMFIGKLGKIQKNKFKRIIFLMQKDVVDRIIAEEGSSKAGALSIRIKLISNVIKICDVPPSSFRPSPKVNSSLVVFKPLESSLRLDLGLERYIDKLLKVAFNARRKKLKNTLKSIFSEQEMDLLHKSCDFNLDLRPQDLSVNQWISIAKFCTKMYD